MYNGIHIYDIYSNLIGSRLFNTIYRVDMYLVCPFYPPVGAGYCHHYVWRVSVFRFRAISLKPLAGLLSFFIHTSLGRCTYAFWGYDL